MGKPKALFLSWHTLVVFAGYDKKGNPLYLEKGNRHSCWGDEVALQEGMTLCDFDVVGFVISKYPEFVYFVGLFHSYKLSWMLSWVAWKWYREYRKINTCYRVRTLSKNGRGVVHDYRTLDAKDYLSHPRRFYRHELTQKVCKEPSGKLWYKKHNNKVNRRITRQMLHSGCSYGFPHPKRNKHMHDFDWW